MTLHPEPGNGNPPPRPRSLVPPPPPDPAEALYYEGMAAYQHRNWVQALDRFTRLKELQPTRPGLDALLDEVRWFLQLQATVPSGAGTVEVSTADKPLFQPAERAWSGRRQTWWVVILAIIGLLALLLFVFQDRLPWARVSDREAQEIFNRGQARLAVGDYEGAEAAFLKLLEIAPNDPEAQLGLSTARRQKALAQSYAAAQAAIADEDWDKAGAELEKILAMDPGYADAQARADFVAQRRRLASLYEDGSRLYDLGHWEEAIAQFERIRELDRFYRPEAVAEFLFVCYMNAGEAAIERADGDVAVVTKAVDYYSRALAIHPRNRLATNGRRLSGLYLEAVRSLAAGNRAEAQSRLEALLAEVPDYGRGEAARQLYRLLLANAESALKAGDIPAAIQWYVQAQAVPGVDVSAAARGLAVARAITPTPTPSPTATPSPTPVPQPVAIVAQGPLNLRSGPGQGYPVVGQARSGDRLLVTGRNADGSWLRVCFVVESGLCRSGVDQGGWLSSRLIEVRGDLAMVAVITPAPPPVNTPLRPTNTLVPRITCITGTVRDVANGSPLAEWTVTLQGVNGSTLSLRSGQDGVYRFAGLVTGSYTVSQRLEPGWRAVSPLSTVVMVIPAADCVVVDFWNSREEAVGGEAPPPAPTPTPRR